MKYFILLGLATLWLQTYCNGNTCVPITMISMCIYATLFGGTLTLAIFKHRQVERYIYLLIGIMALIVLVYQYTITH